MKDQAEIVVIGGGALGASIAYHLVQMGRRDVLLVEKSGLTHGATWHAAGLVGQLRAKRNLTRMLQQSVELYERLEAETGQATDWKAVGSLRVASSKERWREIRRTATLARSFGFELHLVGPGEARELFPPMITDGVEGAAWIPSDGQVDPSGLTQALARGARAGGAEIVEGVRVTGLERDGRRITRVLTDHGAVRAEVVVNAAGMWARRIGAMAGVGIPAGAVEHQYVVTEKIPDLPAGLPTFRDPDKIFYLKCEASDIAMGGWEPDPPAFAPRQVPFEFGRQLLASDYDRFARIAALAAERIPLFAEVGIRELINGPIPFSPDGEPVMGLVPGLDNFFVACGFTAGIAAAGGAGRQLAHWICEGHPEMDLWAFDVRRFGPLQARTGYLHERCAESYSRYYQLHYPGEEPASARGARRSPLYRALAARGAVYGSKFGWERPNWFAAGEQERAEPPSFERPEGFARIGEEHRAVRERVALFDLSSFAKFELEGPQAAATIQRLAVADLDRPPGRVVYTQLCNERGGVECDLTVTRLAADRFYLVTGAGFGVHDGDWIERHLPASGAHLREVTSERAVVSVTGPLARTLLERLAEHPLDEAALPYMGAREVVLGHAPVRALRVSYTGELGYELHVPSEYAEDLYERLRAAGDDLGVTDCGYRALEGLRLEKGYCYWSAELTPDYSPYHAGLGRGVALEKGEFIGREALARIRAEGPAERLCTLTVERAGGLFGGEAVLHGGEVVGLTTSAGYGYTVGRTICLAYLPASLAEACEGFEIEAFGERLPAERAARVLYDPRGERLRG